MARCPRRKPHSAGKTGANRLMLLSDDRSSKSAVGRAHRAFLSRVSLEAEILVLRDQLDVLSRKLRPCAGFQSGKAFVKSSTV